MAILFKSMPGYALLSSLLFTPATSAQSRPPVILVDGGQDCGTPRTFGFGRLEAMLTDQGIRTELFRPCSVPSKQGVERTPIEELAEALAARINELANPEVDLVAFSLGGPIVHCYLSGKQTTSGVFKPPIKHKVRKLVFLGAGHFGGGDDVDLRYGSRFQWDLANWNQGHDDLRQIEAVSLIAFVGEGVTNLTISPSPEDDGAVPMISGSLSFAYPAERTRIIPGCHLRAWCLPGVAYVSSSQHPAWIVIDSFLNGTDAWKAVGHAPDQDPVLSQKGGLLVAVKDAWDNLIPDAQVSISGTAMWKSLTGVGTFVEEHIETGEHTLQASASFPVPDKTVTVKAGTFTVLTMKPGPLLAAIRTAEGESMSPNITAGAVISILGERLADSLIAAEPPFPTSLGSTTVNLNDRPIPLLYVSETLIKAQLPDDVTGFARLTVTSDKGKHSLNLFIGEKNQPALSPNGIVNAASFLPGIAPSSWVSIFGSNLAPTPAPGRIWRDAEIIGGMLPTSLDGVSVRINNKPAAIYFVSSGQLNVQAPDDDHVGSVSVEVTTPGGTAKGTAEMKQFVPGLFTYAEINGLRYASAVHPDGVLVGRTSIVPGARPARPREIILLFGTGFGATTPPRPAGQVIPAAPLATPFVITVGGLQATAFYGGIVGAGLYQFNVEIPDLPDGDHAVVVEVGGERSPSGVVIPIQR